MFTGFDDQAHRLRVIPNIRFSLNNENYLPDYRTCAIQDFVAGSLPRTLKCLRCQYQCFQTVGFPFTVRKVTTCRNF